MFAFSRRTSDIPGPSEDCFIFRWIGQSLQHCDNCGKPLHVHLYNPTYGMERPELYVKQYDSYFKKWEWHEVTVRR